MHACMHIHGVQHLNALQVVRKRYWGLKEDQVILLSVERFPGMVWDEEARAFHVSYSHEHPYSSAGAGELPGSPQRSCIMIAT